MKNSLVLCIFITCLMSACVSPGIQSQVHDWRNVKNGIEIYTNGYIDQPYVVVLDNKDWLVVFTTGEGHEGTGGQHIVSSVSKDQGKTWSEPVRIEEPGEESKSWAMPYLTDFGRVYVFYDYNGDKIHTLGDKKNIREDMLGWYCFKYSDDSGQTWSKRYRLPVRLTEVDRNNDWKGEVQILWGIGKPIDLDNGMMFAFTKIRDYLLENSEGWFFRCMNINTERDPEKLVWENLPEGDKGLKNEHLGTVNAEQNIVQLSNGTVYCMHRTISGFPAESYSYNRGESWTLPVIPQYYTGNNIKHPRACPRIWKCENGKYLFWQHNHGGWDFRNRNPVWISGGIEKDGKIVWTQPEVLLYEDEHSKRMSYPDLIQQDGKYWITETNKENGRCHEVPAEFFDKLWSQYDLKEICRKSLVYEAGQPEINPGKIKKINSFSAKSGLSGFTIDVVLSLTDISPKQEILNITDDNGQKITLETGEFGAVEITIATGEKTIKWSSDPGAVKAFGDNCVAVSVDNSARLIQFVINGIVNDGGDFRQYGWYRFNEDLATLKNPLLTYGILNTGQIRGKSGVVKNARIYDRPLLNTEIIGNHRVDAEKYFIPQLPR